MYFQDPTRVPEPGELPKIGLFMEQAFTRMRTLYQPARECSFDEMIAGFKGRCKFKFTKMKKPTRDGLKVFGYCEARTGFVLTGAVDQRNGRKIADFVTELAESCFAEESGQHIYMDNLFVSPSTFEALMYVLITLTLNL